MMSSHPPTPSHKKLVTSLLMLLTGMVALTAASVPLYNLFCNLTGFGGTTGTAPVAPKTSLAREMLIRFDAQAAPDLAWRFKPDVPSVSVRIGEEKLISFSAENLSEVPLTGRAVYNVTPHEAAPYFMKIECFCFQNQTLAPHQKMHFPVSFFIDPEIANDKNLQNLHTVTLSYTFFLSKKK